MLVYFGMEHEKLSEIDPTLWHQSRANLLRNKYRCERLASRPCLIVRYDDISPEFIWSNGAAIGPIAPIPPGISQLHLAATQNFSGVEQEFGSQPVMVQPGGYPKAQLCHDRP